MEETIICAVFAWFGESPWERLLLCAETATIVVGGPWAWLHRHSLKRQTQGLKRQTQGLKRQNQDLMKEVRDLRSDFNAKSDKLLELMGEMVGKPVAEQKQIVRHAALSASFQGGLRGDLSAGVRLQRREIDADS